MRNRTLIGNRQNLSRKSIHNKTTMGSCIRLGESLEPELAGNS